jgi:23S rRNA pseudouridine2605 synthase
MIEYKQVISMERLQKVIAESGYTSRRKAEELIKAGKVYVDGEKITEMGYKVSGNQEIIVEGNVIAREEHVYFMLNKPRGVISSVQDEADRVTVVDYIDTDKRIYPIGRLDYNTTGLLLLTNDGELANALMHPSKSIPKTYIAKLNRAITPEDLMKLKHGIKVDDRKVDILRVKAKSIDKVKDSSIVEITIVEGRNHIVKRVFEVLGYLVDKLSRTEYAGMTLGNLKSGEYRELSIKEVKRLYDISK